MNSRGYFPSRKLRPFIRKRRSAFRIGGCLLLAGILASRAQTINNWRAYRSSDGLRDSSVSFVNIGPNGDVLVCHREVDAFSVLDGYMVRSIDAEGGGHSRLYQSRTGQLWSLYEDGLQVFQNQEEQWRKFPIDEIRRETRSNLLRLIEPIPLLPTRYDHVLVLLPEKLCEFQVSRDGHDWTPLLMAEETKVGRFLDLIPAGEEYAWITAEKGIIKLSGPASRLSANPERTEFVIPEELGIRNLKRALADREGGITMVGDSLNLESRMIVHFDSVDAQWSVFDDGDQHVRQAWMQEPGALWGIDVNSIFKFEDHRVIELDSRNLPDTPYKDVCPESNGGFWVAGLSGLFRFSPLCWRSPEGFSNSRNPVFSMLETEKGDLWFATSEALVRNRAGRWDRFGVPRPDSETFQQGDTLSILPDGRLAVNLQSGMYEFDQERGLTAYASGDGVSVFREVGVLTDRRRIVLRQSKTNGREERRLLLLGSGTPVPYLDLPEGWQPDDTVYRVHQSATGEIWMLGTPGLYLWKEGRWISYGYKDGYTADYARHILELRNGELWFGGRSRIAVYDGRRFSTIQTALDHVNAMIEAGDGSVWVATGRGLFRYYKESWIENTEREGLPSSVIYDVMEDSRRRIWVGTSRGVSVYQPNADLDPPKTQIITREKSLTPGHDDTVTLRFEGVDKWKFTEADRLLFSCQLDNGVWSPYTSETTATYTNLAAGFHDLKVKAMDRNWNEEWEPALIHFQVVLPWWKDPRLIAISIAGGIVILFLTALAYRSHLRLKESYAEVEQIVKKRTRELEQANKQLLHSQKMRALGTLAAGVAHDFNSILSIIKGSAQIIGRDPANSEKIQTRVGRITAMVDQGSRLIKAMLGFSRHDAGEAMECDLNQVIKETLQILGDRLPSEIRLESQIQNDLPKVRVSKDLIQQMLINLILNAADALEQKGKIIAASSTIFELPEELALKPAEAESWIALSVKDFGRGISEANLSRVFEPFFTTKSLSERKGTGLGLSMVYEFAREMGYGLQAESTVGQGSTFTILVPVNPENHTAQTEGTS